MGFGPRPPQTTLHSGRAAPRAWMRSRPRCRRVSALARAPLRRQEPASAGVHASETGVDCTDQPGARAIAEHREYLARTAAELQRLAERLAATQGVGVWGSLDTERPGLLGHRRGGVAPGGAPGRHAGRPGLLGLLGPPAGSTTFWLPHA